MRILVFRRDVCRCCVPDNYERFLWNFVVKQWQDTFHVFDTFLQVEVDVTSVVHRHWMGSGLGRRWTSRTYRQTSRELCLALFVVPLLWGGFCSLAIGDCLKRADCPVLKSVRRCGSGFCRSVTRFSNSCSLCNERYYILVKLAM
jgi:hypothetical protein